MRTPASRPRPIRRTALVALPLSAALALTACSGGSSSGSLESPDKPKEPVSLRMTVWTADETQLKQFQEIADAYVADHPDLVKSVKFDPIPFDDYTPTLTTQLAGGNAPDLAWILESYAPQFVESGALADIKPVLSKDADYKFDDIVPSALKLWEKGTGSTPIRSRTARSGSSSTRT
ncbi:hypothetical protein GCM10025864_13480 [Luteimicrobium album]|uniref:Extracellular solute-binding protein n=1 Tax=Luteimicrobium album TaxID=1054550 RepID=A0ABQ6HYL5_9MICO|nr:extracellular solute-binding protein [Luteimicrobium album]GMA23589.1 hypothetical protein GCM10025864_13480 [Luteimicrobium album]